MVFKRIYYRLSFFINLFFCYYRYRLYFYCRLFFITAYSYMCSHFYTRNSSYAFRQIFIRFYGVEQYFIYYIYNMYACRPEEVIRCGPTRGCWELNSGPLEEQSVLLTAEPSLQPFLFINLLLLLLF